MNIFEETARKAQAEREARGPVVWVVTAIVNGTCVELERTAMLRYEAASQVEDEFPRARILSTVEKSLIERNAEINRQHGYVVQ